MQTLPTIQESLANPKIVLDALREGAHITVERGRPVIWANLPAVQRYAERALPQPVFEALLNLHLIVPDPDRAHHPEHYLAA